MDDLTDETVDAAETTDTIDYDETAYSPKRLLIVSAVVTCILATITTWDATQGEDVRPVASPQSTPLQSGGDGAAERRVDSDDAPAPPPGCFSTADSAERILQARGSVPACVLQWREELRHQRAVEWRTARRCSYPTADVPRSWLKLAKPASRACPLPMTAEQAAAWIEHGELAPEHLSRPAHHD